MPSAPDGSDLRTIRLGALAFLFGRTALQNELDVSPHRSYGILAARLDALRRARLLVSVQFGVLATLAGLLALALLLAAVEAVFYAPVPVRVALLLAACSGAVLSLLWLAVRPLTRPETPQELALRLEGHFPQLKQRLISVLQLWSHREHNPEGYSTQMIEALARQAQDVARELDFSQIVDRRRPLLAARFLGVVVLVWVVAALSLTEAVQGALGRYRHPLASFARPADTFLHIEPGDCRTIKGQDVAVRIALQGIIPNSVQIASKPDYRKVWREAQLATDGRDTLTYVFRNPMSSLDYTVTAGDAQSPLFRLTVIDRPVVTQLQQRYEFPAYTRLEPRTETERAGDISALRGTRVSFEIVSSKALSAARLAFSDSSHLACSIEARVARTTLNVQEAGTYYIQLLDLEGFANAQPIQYRVLAIPDEAPTVRVVSPGEDVDLGESMLVGLVVEAVDDFGFSAMDLVYVWADRKPVRLPIPLPGESVGELRVQYVWDLGNLDLMPEDQVTYHVEVSDNDTVSGPKTGSSAQFVVRFPSIHEILQEVEQDQQRQIDEVARILEEGKTVREHLEAARRELLKQEDLPWEKKRDVEAVLDKQRQMAEDLKRISDRVGEAVDKLQKSGIITLETLEKLGEIRRLMAEIATPQLQEALARMKEAVDQVNPQKLEQAIKQFSLSHEEYQRKLERTLAILKQVRIEQKMDAVIKEAEQLLQRQEDINERAASSPNDRSAEELAQQEDRAARDTDRLREDLEELAALMEDAPDMPEQEIRALAEQMQAGDLSGQMRGLSQMLRSGQRQQCAQAGARIADRLTELQQGLSGARTAMQDRLKQEIQEDLARAMSDLLLLSDRQESLVADLEGIHPSSLRFGPLAESEQWLLEGAAKVADNLYRTAQKTFFVSPIVTESLGRVLSSMEAVLGGLKDRQTYTAANRAKDAMVALNTTVLLLRQAIANVQSGDSPTGFQDMLEQLSRLGQQQQEVNQGTRPLLGKGGGLSLDERAQMARLAAEQEAIRQALQQLEEQLSGRRNVLGRLDQMAAQINEVVKDLKRSRVSRNTIDRQEQILSRLLDAQRSIRERGYSKQRESRSAGEFAARDPSALPDDLGERETALRRDLLNALKEGYPKQYEELIRRYFEALVRDPVERPR